MVVWSAGDARGIALEGVCDVGVDRSPVALHFPVRRNGNLFPGTYIEVGLVEVDRAKVRLLDPVKLPASVERLHPWGVVGVMESGWLIGEWREGGARGLFVDAEYVRVLPVRRRGGLRLRSEAHGREQCQGQQRTCKGFHFWPLPGEGNGSRGNSTIRQA